jgi:biopolymer transport protein ExbD
MKNLIFLNVIIILFFSCKAQDNKIENQLLECYNEKSMIDDILEFEKELISQKILDDGSGKSYIQLLEKIRDGNDISVIIPENQKNILITQEISDCQKKIFNSTEYPNSKIYKINEHFKKISETKNISVFNVVDGVLRILKAEDFEIPYYKLSAFKMLSVHNTELGIQEKLPNETKYIKETDYKNSITIGFNLKNEIIINDKAFNKSEFQTKINEYLQNKKDKSVFIIQSSRSTLYRVYENTIYLLEQEIMKLRNEYSQKEYKLNYNELKAENKSKVKKIYPKRIMEITIDK